MGGSVQQPANQQALDQIFATSTYVIVDFYADWCGPCRQIAPIFTQLASTHAVPDVLTFAKVNVDELKSFAAQHNISSIPTFMFFKDGKQVAANGKSRVQDVAGLKAAAEKIGGLAKTRAAAA